MEKYLIVTDTTSAMDQEIAQKNGIELISLSVIVDGHEYKDQIDISTKQLYDYLRDGKIPSTSQVILLNKWKNGKKKIMKQSLLLLALQIYQEQTTVSILLKIPLV